MNKSSFKVDGLSNIQKIAIQTDPKNLVAMMSDTEVKSDIIQLLKNDNLLMKILKMFPSSIILDGIDIKVDTNNTKKENHTTLYDYLFDAQWINALHDASVLMNIYGSAIIVIGAEEKEVVQKIENMFLHTTQPNEYKNLLRPLDATLIDKKADKPIKPIAITNTFTKVEASSVIHIQNKDQTLQEYDKYLIDEFGNTLYYYQIAHTTFDSDGKKKMVQLIIHPSRIMSFDYDTTLAVEQNPNARRSCTSFLNTILPAYTKYYSVVSEVVLAMNRSNQLKMSMPIDELNNYRAQGETTLQTLQRIAHTHEQSAKEGGILMEVTAENSSLSGTTTQTNQIKFDKMQSNFANLESLVDITKKNLSAYCNIPLSVLMGNQESGGLQTSTNEKDIYNKNAEEYGKMYLQHHIDRLLNLLKSIDAKYNWQSWEFKQAIPYTTQEEIALKQSKVDILEKIARTIDTFKASATLIDIDDDIMENIREQIKSLSL